ncbi:SDR family NAD(P)-dependent oxidoreductase [Arthrobacter cupressi]|uniref:Dihydroanticapsin dehydrogenase n=1 Tax=Arthrobacter cupressi TaxID=1045773 RepID=A0A1G8LFV9_9MICC|nr:SDR family oxidoreductase [Arthrobacter cupressi]NYD77639.1 NAD(P)-dependent dehydrogenase (short-subunit alcohol dehydrogenase family) [Arthrobacter cupressi]SDI54505.1 dihydroanticapsin dehydrogenase [Arthrobacter cupressi]
MRLEGKTAIVTGAASGQGLATVRALVRHGANVMAADIDDAGLEDLARENDRIAIQRCDVSKPADVERLVDAAEQQFGAVHAMLNCAGFLRAASVLETTEDMLDRIVDINLKGVFYGCKYVIPALQRAGGGSIVNWGSVNSMVAEPDIAAYSASKGAVLMITKSVAVEYAKDNIRANCLCPGGVRTPMVEAFFDDNFLNDEQAQRAYQPLGLIVPEEVADVAVFLVSDDSRKMTGSAVVVDAGYTAI